MNRKFILVALFLGTTFSSFAQAQTPPIGEVSLFERVNSIQKKCDKFNLFLNTQNSFDVNLRNGNMTESGFRCEQLRIEALGNINDKIFYRWRQRLNRPNIPQSRDNQPYSIDYAAIGYWMRPNLSLFAGKQCAAYGGFEFDLNPIDVYEYCDMIEYMSNFMMGVSVGYRFNENQELIAQVLNSRNGSFADVYGSLPDFITSQQLSLSYTLNWNAAFWNKLLQLRWSATLLNEAKSHNMYYFAAGQKLNLGRFSTFVDFLYSIEDLDRKRIMTSFTENFTDGMTARNVRYMSLIWSLHYQISPHFTVFGKGMYETSGVFKSYDGIEKGKYRTALGYLGGVEYYPLTDSGLHFFATFVGRSYDFTHRAKDQYALKNYNTQRFSVGFIYKIPLY